jgi:hypothetical protein
MSCRGIFLLNSFTKTPPCAFISSTANWVPLKMSSPVGVTGPVKCVNNPIFIVEGAVGVGLVSCSEGVKVKKATPIPTAAIINLCFI